MKPKRYLSAVFLMTALLAVTSCMDDRAVNGPEQLPSPDYGLFDGLLKPTGLLDCKPLPYASATETIGPAGGVLRVGPHRLVVPPKSLSEPVTITAEAPTSSVRRVEFQPEGLQFSRGASLTMSYEGCKLLGLLLPKRIAYVEGLNILYFLPSLDDLFNQRVTGRLEHFSQYAVAW
ncbi:MAG TPA: hypothetical protein VD793_04355 [Gemmatimonadales bacterium]|nr:hypothetical protein [Gemmatimonadales bacterium]